MGILDEAKWRWQQANTPINYEQDTSSEHQELIENVPKILLGPTKFALGYRGAYRTAKGIENFYHQTPAGGNKFYDATSTVGRPLSRLVSKGIENMFWSPKIPEKPYEYGWEEVKQVPRYIKNVTPALRGNTTPAIESAANAINQARVTATPSAWKTLVPSSVPLFNAVNMFRGLYNGTVVPFANAALFVTGNAMVLASPWLMAMSDMENSISRRVGISNVKPSAPTYKAPMYEASLGDEEAQMKEAAELPAKRAAEFTDNFQDKSDVEVESGGYHPNDDSVMGTFNLIDDRKKYLDTASRQQYALDTLMDKYTVGSDYEAESKIRNDMILLMLAGKAPEVLKDISRNALYEIADQKREGENAAYENYINSQYLEP